MSDTTLKTKLALQGPVFSLDVECVADGYDHHARTPAKFALVNEAEKPVCEAMIQPAATIVSYLTPITGLTARDFDSAVSFEAARAILLNHLPTNAILVGQRIDSDIKWMQLRQGEHFKDSIDLAILFRSWNPKYQNYAYHSLLHEAQHILHYKNVDSSQPHDPVMDAKISICLWKKIVQNPQRLPEYQTTLRKNRPQQSVAKRLGYKYEGVCMSRFNPRLCICQAKND